ncbi:DUF72 domain-containing protein [Gordonia metallireducens]|uniref:DUF72 domain-containing protein n=1 Tax=Gordonia metallireducens TaxID=2897779 RepID=UPI001E29404D|nr:DUF72 domain-containing protein [Gordonia metallireducens]
MLHIGTSGWQYKDWRGAFYPEQVPQREWLDYYSERFTTAEVNNTFYRLPDKTVFENWAETVPADFRMAAKMSRYLTHVKRLKEPAEPVERFLDRAAGLGTKLGPVLLQLPPNLQAQPDALAATLELFPDTVQVVVEPRHESWWTDEVRDVLERHHAALCWADRKSRSLTPLWRTADFGYLRLHDGTAKRPMSYGVQAIDSWLRRLWDMFDDECDVYVYFNNDPGCAAIDNARTMIRRARALGMPVATFDAASVE